MKRLILASLVCFSAQLTTVGDEQPFHFTRLVAHWAQYGGDNYLPFIRDAQPDVAQHGFYGAHFWSLAHTPQYKGYPAHFPVQGLSKCGDWMQARNREIRKLGVRVVGHFNVEFLVGEPGGKEGPRGFFHFYKNLWDEKELGPKPVADPTEFLERNKDGSPIINNSYSIGGMREYWACLRNPHWQAVLKAWVKRGIERGLDGFIANYFYRHNCHCDHCQKEFRAYLRARFTPGQLKSEFKISDLNQHEFDEIIAWHKPSDSTPLRREMLRWSQISNKRVFDEVFIKYGRSLKPDLLVAQWNHLGNFSQISGDERCLLPSELWGRGESYAWYSTGGAAYYTDLENRFLGEGTLQARYIRGAFEDKPFTLGKYENTRTRVAIAELAANGGAPMGFYTRFTNPDARKVIVQYYQFLKRYDEIFRANRPYAEFALLFPRAAVHHGQVSHVDRFRELGRRLLDEHLLFDVLADDIQNDRLKRYRSVINPSMQVDRPTAAPDRSEFKAPHTVRVSASRPAKNDTEIDLHFVNYNRTEPPKLKNGRPNAGRGTQDEKPIATKPIDCRFLIPKGHSVAKVEVVSPEFTTAITVSVKEDGGKAEFTLPPFLVYSIARVQLK